MNPADTWNPVAPPAYEVAAKWRRLVAYIIDNLLLVIPVLVLGIPIFFLSMDDLGGLFVEQPNGMIELRPGGEKDLNDVVRNVGLVGIVLQFVYFVGFTSLTGETPGKRWLHIMVIGQDGGPDPTSALVRYLVLFGPGVIPSLLAVGGVSLGLVGTLLSFAILPIVLWSFIDAAGRGLHDLAGGTAVVGSSTVQAPRDPDLESFGGGQVRGW